MLRLKVNVGLNLNQAMAPGIRPMMGASPFGMAASTQAMADSNQQLDPFGAL